MAQMLTGSIDLSLLGEKFKDKHSAFSVGKSNGRNYASVVIWVNDQPDQYGNTVSIQLNSQKDKREMEGKIYVGNAKPVQQAAAIPQQHMANSYDEQSDLPF